MHDINFPSEVCTMCDVVSMEPVWYEYFIVYGLATLQVINLVIIIYLIISIFRKNKKGEASSFPRIERK
jgi:hypothetical protein